MSLRSPAFRRFGFAAFLAAMSLFDVAAALAKEGAIRRLTHDPDARGVELFAALSEGLISARVTPHDELKSNVFLTNTTKEPLTVELPKAVAAVPLLKQFGSGFIGGSSGPFGQNNQGQNGQNNRNNAAQSVGGQLSVSGPQSSNQNGQTGFFPGSNFFSIPPEKTVRIELQSVCLNHGKRTPSSKMTYELRPLADEANDPALVVVLLESPDFFQTGRPAIQAAAWNLQNGVPLRSLMKETVSGRQETYGAGNHLATAQRLIDGSRKVAAETKPTTPTRTEVVASDSQSSRPARQRKSR